MGNSCTSAGFKSHQSVKSHITPWHTALEGSHIRWKEVTSKHANPNGTASPKQVFRKKKDVQNLAQTVEFAITEYGFSGFCNVNPIVTSITGMLGMFVNTRDHHGQPTAGSAPNIIFSFLLGLRMLCIPLGTVLLPSFNELGPPLLACQHVCLIHSHSDQLGQGSRF